MKKNKGITLVALIITIVIMLILVAVSVNVLIKSNLIGTAEKTVNKYKTAAEEESNLGGIVINGIRYGAIEDYAKGGAAKLDNVKYQTLQEAIDKVPADNTEKTITVLRDIYENTKIPENKNIILDLDNNTIMCSETSKPVMEIDGKVTISNGTVKGEGLEDYVTLRINKDAEVTIVNSNIEETSKEPTITIYGILNIKSGEITSSISNAIVNNGKLIIDGGKVNGTCSNYPTIAIATNSEVIINNGKLNSESCISIMNNGGKLTVNNGEFNSNTTGNFPTIGLMANSETIIKGGKISAQNYFSIINQNNAKLTISGGTITGKNNAVVSNRGIFEMDGGTIEYTGEIKDTTSAGGSFALYNRDGTVEIDGGTIRSSAIALREKSGTVTINGGELYGKNMAIEILGGTLNINNGTIESTENSTGTSMALNMSNNCIVNFNGGTLKTIDSMKLGSGSTFNHYGGTITKTGTAGENFTGEGTYNDKR